MKKQKREQHGIRRGRVVYIVYYEGSCLIEMIESHDYGGTWGLTSMPKSARTVSLLASFALRSPISPGIRPDAAKCIVNAVFEPPATTPQRARNAPLKHSDAMRSDEPVPCFTNG